MKVCGVDLKGAEAIICILTFTDGLFSLPECRVRKVELDKRNRSSDIRYFQQTFSKLLSDYKITEVAIRERPLKGKFAGGALGFKMEAAIQTIADINVNTLSSSAFKQIMKRNPIPVEFNETGLKIFQQNAFETAYAQHMLAQFPDCDKAE